MKVEIDISEEMAEKITLIREAWASDCMNEAGGLFTPEFFQNMGTTQFLSILVSMEHSRIRKIQDAKEGEEELNY